MGPWSRAELLDLYRRYVQEAMAIAELVDDLWQVKGYANVRGAVSVVGQAWKRNGWPTRRRGETKKLARSRRGPTLSRRRALSEEEARRLHPLHWDEWKSINELARENHERLGMTQSALCSQLSYTWKLLGLPRHDRIEMTVRKSTIHGRARRARPKDGGKFGNGSKSPGYKRWLMNQRAGVETRNPFCEGTNAKGEPCKARAMDGRTHCQTHDPDRIEKAKAITAKMHAARDAKYATMLEWEPLRAELRAAFEYLCSWTALAEKSGIDARRLSQMSRDTKRLRISREKAAPIRRALDQVVPLEALRAAA